MDLKELIGEGTELTPMQMSIRAVIIFIITLVLVRLSGKRSFGMHSPFDNVLIILLGAILSRAVVGASPFISTIAASLALVIMHKTFGWISLKSDKFGTLIKGNKTLVFEKGKMLHENMAKCQISEKDIHESLRLEANTGTLDDVEVIYIERNGKLSIVKK